MTGNEYQNLAKRTLLNAPGMSFTDDEIMSVWCAIGVASEAGELANLVKKQVFHRHKPNLSAIACELGDTLWYIAGLCSTIGISLDDVMKHNVAKLQERFPNGFDIERSINRPNELTFTKGEVK